MQFLGISYTDNKHTMRGLPQLAPQAFYTQTFAPADPLTIMFHRMSSPRQAFTLLELVVVIAIIIALAGISLAAVGVVRSSQRKTSTLALVNAVALAIEAYQTDTLTMPPATPVREAARATLIRTLLVLLPSESTDNRLLPIFDLDLDFTIDPRPTTVPNLTTLVVPDENPGFYQGFAAMVGGQLPNWAINSDGYVIDRWATPLRIDWPGWRTDAQKDAAGVGAARGSGARLYGAAKVGVWSLGPDRADGAPGTAAETDNLRSW